MSGTELRPEWLDDPAEGWTGLDGVALREVEAQWLAKRARRLGWTPSGMIREFVVRAMLQDVQAGLSEVTRHKGKTWRVRCRDKPQELRPDPTHAQEATTP